MNADPTTTSPRLLEKKLIVVSGKGGVGKTTVAFSLAQSLARAGKKTLFAQMRARDWLGPLHGKAPIREELVSFSDKFNCVNMTPESALREYGGMVLRSEKAFSILFENRMSRAFLRGTPGLDSWSMLGKAYYHALGHGPDGQGDHDVVVLDAPASGHAVSTLGVPFTIARVAPPGLLRREAVRASELLCDPERMALVWVTRPEPMPITETLETDRAMRRLGLPPSELVLNGVCATPSMAPNFDSVAPSAELTQMLALHQRRQQTEVAARMTLRAEWSGNWSELPMIPGGVDASVLADFSSTLSPSL